MIVFMKSKPLYFFILIGLLLSAFAVIVHAKTKVFGIGTDDLTQYSKADVDEMIKPLERQVQDLYIKLRDSYALDSNLESLEARLERRLTALENGDSFIAFFTNQSEKLRITSRGRVGIGTGIPQGKLDVKGTIYQRGRKIHADYVFDSSYHIESIEEHAKFMWDEKHLKAVPKATKGEDGLDIIEYGSHMRGMLEELEKAHIYIAQLNELIKEQKKIISAQSEAISQLSNDINLLKGRY